MDSKLPTAGSGRLMAVHFLLLILPRIPAKGMGPPIVGRSSTSVTLMGIIHQHPVPQSIHFSISSLERGIWVQEVPQVSWPSHRTF